MLEIVALRFVNKFANSGESKTDKGLLFVPQDLAIREISEAMYLDGAHPYDINKVSLDLAKKKRQEDKEVYEKQLLPIRDSLILDGANNKEIERIIVDIKKEQPFEQKPVLALSGASRTVGLL